MASLLLRNLHDLFSRELKVRAARNGRTIEEEHRRIVESALVEPTPPERQRHTVAKRLNQLLRMLNDGGRGRPEMTIPRMAELLGLNTASGLESYFLAEDEAPFDLLDRIAETFGLRQEWLKFGRYEPFNICTYSVRELHLPDNSCPEYQRVNLAHVVQVEKPQRIFFVRCLDEVRNATIFLQTSQWRYVGFLDGWHVSNHVGATGEAQIFELWELLKLIEGDRDLRRITSGRDLPEGVFRDLHGGETFPGAVLWDERFFSRWADDFTDVHQVFPIARASVDEEMPKNGEGYARYGTGFQQAQAIVRQHLKYEDAK
jgi:plasmid stability protein